MENKKLIDWGASKPLRLIEGEGQITAIDQHSPLSYKSLISDEPEWDEFRRLSTFYSKKNNLIYVATPKVACTSIKWWFAELEGVAHKIIENSFQSTESDLSLIVHDLFHKISPASTNFSREEFKRVMERQDYFKFALVRNPYTRIFSAWQSKLFLREPYQSKPYLNFDFFRLPFNSIEDIAFGFEAFLEHLYLREAPIFWDVHWTPQTCLLLPNEIPYTQISKIENTKILESSLKKFLRPGIPSPFSKHRDNESLIPFSRQFISNRSAEIIQILYQADFDQFNYSNEIPENGTSISDDDVKNILKAAKMVRGRLERFGEIQSCNESIKNQIFLKEGMIFDREERIDNLTQTVTHREEQLKSLNEEIARINQEWLTACNEIANREERIGNLTQIVNQREEQLKSLNEEMARINQEWLTAHNEIAHREEQLKIREKFASIYEQKVGGYPSEIARINQEWLTACNEIVNREERIGNLTQIVTQREEQLKSLNEEIARINQEWLTACNEIVNREDRIGNLTETLASAYEDIAKYGFKISELKNEIKIYTANTLVLNNLLLERGSEISMLNFKLEQNSLSINELNKVVFHREEHIELLLKEIARVNQEWITARNLFLKYQHESSLQESIIVHLNQELIQKNTVIKEIKSSNSWLITKPLRSISYFIRMIKSMVIK